MTISFEYCEIKSSLEKGIIEGENPVYVFHSKGMILWSSNFYESSTLGSVDKEGARSHLKLNNTGRPIVKK